MRVSKFLFFCFIIFFKVFELKSQVEDNKLDSLYIQETENIKGKDKVFHAEPLFIDLIRDLGARKGEKEWNIGVGLTDNINFDSYSTLIEYEWAPIDRLGLEVEVPFTFYYQTNNINPPPKNTINSLKLAGQYSFYVSEKRSISLAFGYIHEFETYNFGTLSKNKLIKGNVFNPFFIAAKRWNNNFHSLIYTGPYIEKPIHEKEINSNFQINSNFHYMISGTRNFIGLELNKIIYQNDFEMVFRPQMRLSIADNMMIGIVTGVPVSRKVERLSTFFRIIYEPNHKH